MCFKDNKDWICTGGIGSCLIQVSLSPSTPLPTSSSAALSSNLPTPTTSPSPTTTIPEHSSITKDIMIGY